MADPSDETTVVGAIASVRAAGYTADFAVAAGGAVRCGSCGHLHAASDLVADRIVRVEGVSDPADQAAVLALRCQRCDTRGVLVVAYGPTASADEAAVLTAVHDRPARDILGE